MIYNKNNLLKRLKKKSVQNKKLFNNKKMNLGQMMIMMIVIYQEQNFLLNKNEHLIFNKNNKIIHHLKINNQFKILKIILIYLNNNRMILRKIKYNLRKTKLHSVNLNFKINIY